MVSRYRWFNPHLTLSFDWQDEHHFDCQADNPEWVKWRPSDHTSAHWYDHERFTALATAYVNADRQNGAQRTVRDFVREFRGLSSTVKAGEILNDLSLARLTLNQALVVEDSIDEELTGRLLAAMQAASTPVKPRQLGVIGQDYFNARLTSAWDCDRYSLRYKRIEGEDDGTPFVVEAAFGAFVDISQSGGYVSAVNWSPAIRSPFRALGEHDISLDKLLADRWVGNDEPALVMLHVAFPRASYADRGKSTVALPLPISIAVIEAVENVTKKWNEIREKEFIRQYSADKRQAAAAARAANKGKISQVAAAGELMEEAYLWASDNGTLPAQARQIMYRARPQMLILTERTEISDHYFTQTLLPDFVIANPQLTANWDVVYDARGRFREPHTGREVPLGTLHVRKYLADSEAFKVEPIHFDLPTRYPTMGPKHRYGAALFVEKEGFDHLLRAVRLEERYDIAAMSTKGMSNVAARELIDKVSQWGVPIFVLHDFDKSGFSIIGTLRKSARRYKFQNPPKVIDIGLRLEDLDRLGITKATGAETVKYKRTRPESLRKNLTKNGATPQEIAFLLTHRVELNALNSRQLVDLIEAKLDAHGVEKLVPDEATLADAYQRASIMQEMQGRLDALAKDARAGKTGISVPPDIATHVREALEADPTLSWDAALTRIVKDGKP